MTALNTTSSTPTPKPRGAQITSLFGNDVLHRVERMRLNPVNRKTNRMRGEHLRGKGGSSTEFADYRDYSVGDDVRFVDWNIFARLNRPYLKLFEHEEEMHVVLLIDASSSMMFENKFDCARQLAAAFGVMGLMNLERVSCYIFNQSADQMSTLRPVSGRQSMHKLFSFLEGAEGGGDRPLNEAIDSMLLRHRGKGVCVLLSDFLTYGDLQRSFNMLFSAGLEIYAVQILSQSEINPDLAGDARLVDSETGNVLDVTAAGNLLNMYHEYRETFQRKIEAMARQRSGRFVPISSAVDVKTNLVDVFQRRGWIR